MNCASSFRGLHEAVINHTGNRPQILTCPHEEISVSMAQGYAKIEGRPMAVACHGTVGLQHASMAIYNAWCDRVPVYVMIGNIIEADKRGLRAEWRIRAIDPAAMVRDFVKWDDQPASLQHFAESAVRACKIAMTAPMGPVLLSLDGELQENPIEDRGRPAHPETRGRRAPGRRSRRDRRGGALAGRCASPGDPRGPDGPHARCNGAPGSSWPNRFSARSSTKAAA